MENWRNKLNFWIITWKEACKCAGTLRILNANIMNMDSDDNGHETKNDIGKGNLKNLCLHAGNDECKCACMLTFLDTDIINMHQYLEIETRAKKW